MLETGLTFSPKADTACPAADIYYMQGVATNQGFISGNTVPFSERRVAL